MAVSGNAGFGVAVGSRRAAFRRWRQTRPFWGGFLLLLAGIELLLIPLSGILIHGAVKLVVYIGIGGSMGFAWTPSADQPTRWPLGPRHGSRLMAAAVLPLMLAGTTLVGQNAAHDTTPPPQQGCILGILCFPSPTPSQAPSPSPTPAATAGTGATPGSSPSPGSTPQPSMSAGSTSGSQSKSKTAGTPGVEASTAASVIVAGSATLDGMSYQGTAQVPTASGTLSMMKFTMSSLTLTGGVRATVTQNGQTTVTTNSSLDFSGGVVLYATKLSGSLLGVPITLTPGNVVSVLLKLLNSLTPVVSVTMTNVTTDDFLVAADSLQANDLNITSG